MAEHHFQHDNLSPKKNHVPALKDHGPLSTMKTRQAQGLWEMRNPQCWGHPGLKCMLSLPQNRMFVHFKAAQNPLANDNWLLMQVYPLGSVLYWKKCVQFLDCLSWLVQIQRLPPGISLERVHWQGLWKFQPHRRVPLLQGTWELQYDFSPALSGSNSHRVIT